MTFEMLIRQRSETNLIYWGISSEATTHVYLCTVLAKANI